MLTTRSTYYISNFAFVISALLVLYFIVMSLLALFECLPLNFEATFELPLILDNTSQFYSVNDLNDNFISKGIELKHVELEVLPVNNSFAQFLSYLHAAFYVSIFSFILFMISKIIKTLIDKESFHKLNSSRINKIALAITVLAIYDWFVRWIVDKLYVDLFIVNNARFTSVTVLDITIELFFFALLLFTLSHVFKRGYELQDFENHTV